MKNEGLGKNIAKWAVVVIAIVFGLVTIKSGGQVLFGSEEARIAAGDYIPFVLWFNFAAGFLYVIAGIGIVLQKKWSMNLALFIMFSTAAVFAAFGLNIFIADIAYESRTVGAMALRTTVWTVISALLYKQYVSLGKGV